MSITATCRPASTKRADRGTCNRCGITRYTRNLRPQSDGTPYCRDCDDVENPKPCIAGHQRTEDNIYERPGRPPQCAACIRMKKNIARGWEWACQGCGRRADQGEVLCAACGQVSETTPLSYTLGSSKTAPDGASTPTEGLARTTVLTRPGGDGL